MRLVKIGWRKNLPRTSRNRSYFFVCSRKQICQVENRLKAYYCIKCDITSVPRYGNEPNYDEMANSVGKKILLLTILNAQYGVTTVRTLSAKCLVLPTTSSHAF